ncbi:MAG: hypothetical protein HZB68_02475 [Candidatus Aenigmarchaeota archaeon]|nr:hypothetical protein [Candidatus Aenigmarchaeota archaeon]
MESKNIANIEPIENSLRAAMSMAVRGSSEWAHNYILDAERKADFVGIELPKERYESIMEKAYFNNACSILISAKLAKREGMKDAFRLFYDTAMRCENSYSQIAKRRIAGAPDDLREQWEKDYAIKSKALREQREFIEGL